MSKSTIEVPELGKVHITKKRGQRSLRLRVDSKGQIQVSIPWIVPKSAALDFVLAKKDWLQKQQTDRSISFYDGMLLGKTLRLKIIENSQLSRSRQTDKEVTIHFSGAFNPIDDIHNAKIEKAIHTALRTEAEKVLLPRLKEFATEYDFSFNSAGVKQLVGRWGSCDSNRHILLSLYLIQLPIELIDYVLLHELTHTKHMNHSPAFWSHLERFCPDYKDLRRRMKNLQPRIYDAKAFMS